MVLFRRVRAVGHQIEGEFHLVGGSHETHEVMQEKCLKFNEKLDSRGKQLEDLTRTEFHDMAAECEMNVAAPPEPS